MKTLVTFSNPSNTQLQSQFNLWATLYSLFFNKDEVETLDSLPYAEEIEDSLADLIGEIMEEHPIAEILEKVPEATDTLISMGWELTVYDYFTGKVVKAVDEALKNYGTDVVSVDYNEETDMIDINECHSSWSDVIAEAVAYRDNVDLNELVAELDKRGVGHCGL